jgi:hypothetical protein
MEDPLNLLRIGAATGRLIEQTPGRDLSSTAANQPPMTNSTLLRLCAAARSFCLQRKKERLNQDIKLTARLRLLQALSALSSVAVTIQRIPLRLLPWRSDLMRSKRISKRQRKFAATCRVLHAIRRNAEDESFDILDWMVATLDARLAIAAFQPGDAALPSTISLQSFSR